MIPAPLIKTDKETYRPDSTMAIALRNAEYERMRLRDAKRMLRKRAFVNFFKRSR